MRHCGFRCSSASTLLTVLLVDAAACQRSSKLTPLRGSSKLATRFNLGLQTEFSAQLSARAASRSLPVLAVAFVLCADRQARRVIVVGR